MIPETSTTLLKDLGSDATHKRWTEFSDRYAPMMQAYMRERFPSLEADDIIQETLVSLVTILPSYRHSPEDKGAFHNYLTGIMRRKALKALGKSSAAQRRDKAYAGAEMISRGEGADAAYRQWREAILELALRELLADDTIQSRTREVFRRVAVNGEPPGDVARSFGIERNAVDQIKSRMTAKLKAIADRLEKS